MKLKKILFYIVIFILASSISITVWMLNIYHNYVDGNPPTTIPSAEKCTANGLVAHWKLDESENDSTPDSSVNNIIGKYKYWINDLSRIIYGKPKIISGMDGNALEFKGKQWISAGNNGCFNTEQFTISAWVWQDHDYLKDPSNKSIKPWPYNVPTIMAKSSWPYDGWWLCSTTADVEGKIHYRDIDVGISWGNGFTHIKSGYQLPLREWHHIVVSLDNINHEAQFYIDGKIYGAKQTGLPKWLLNWNHDLFIGEYDGSGRWPWYGKLDDIRYYNKTLNKEEVIEIFKSNKLKSQE